MEKLESALQTLATGSRTPTVVADGSSVVMTGKIQGMQTKHLKMKIETEPDPENKPGNAVGPAPHVDYFARDGSIIFADVMTGIVADTIDLSVCAKRSKVCAERVDESPLPSEQGPAVRFIIDHKVELIGRLRADSSLLLQHVHAQNIVTEGQYLKIKSISDPEKAVIEIIDHVISKGQEICSRFLKLLRNNDVLETYPELKEMTDLI